jgi:MFS family permease
MEISLILRALKHRNYKLFFSGQIISLTGTWMQQVALSWLVYSMTGSAFILGVVGFSSQVPTFILAPFAGVLIDRWDKHKIIIITQFLLMLIAFLFAFLIYTGLIQVWHIIALNIITGFINGFDMPARQSFMIEIVEKREDLSNAIALNSSVFNAARLIGPSIAGLFIAAVGEAACFLFNGISFIAVIIALLAMRIKPFIRENGMETNVIAGLKEGFKYTFGFQPIRSLILLIALMSLWGMPYTVLMPVFAKDVLHGGAHTLGFLMGAVGMGALTGAIYLASRKSILGLGKLIVFAGITFGIGLICFSQSVNLYFSLLVLSVTGASMMMQSASCNTILQTIVDDNMRGRVMSFYTMSFMGMMPFGSLISGSIASGIGAPATLTIGGIICIFGGILFASQLKTIRRMVAPIYRKIGIIPEIAAGIQNTSNIRVPPEN